MKKSENTIINYNSAISFFYELKNLKLRDISYLDIIKILEKSNLKQSTIILYTKIMKKIFNDAIKKYKIIENNPFNEIEFIKERNDKTINSFTKVQLYNLLKKIKNDDFDLYIACLLTSHLGLRIGEALALTIKDFDFNKNVVTINKQYQNKKIKNVKSINSNRKIPIPKELSIILKNLKLKNNCFLINKSYNYLSNILRTKYKINFHKFRHTYATLLISNNIDIKTVAYFMGDNVETIINTYIHFNNDMFINGQKKINNIFTNNI